MNCKFELTKYRHVDGRPVSKCNRAGCDQIAFQAPWNIYATCRAPQWAAGDAAARGLGKFGITKESWPKIKHFVLVAFGLRDYESRPGGCNCEPRRRWLNRWFSFAMPAWVYRLLVLLRFRSPAVDRIAQGVRIGIIRAV